MRESFLPIWLALDVYAILVIVIAASTRWIFNSGLVVALLLNITPLITIFALAVLLTQYQVYADRSDMIGAARTAISDAPAIHLGEPFAKKVDSSGGGVIIFLHVPFTVERSVSARSVSILTSQENSRSLKFSSRPECDRSFAVPTYGFHIVDRDYSGSPLANWSSGTKIVSAQLDPNKQYYLLQERHFTYAPCRVSDYEEFEPKNFHVNLSTADAERILNGSP